MVDLRLGTYYDSYNAHLLGVVFTCLIVNKHSVSKGHLDIGSSIIRWTYGQVSKLNAV